MPTISVAEFLDYVRRSKLARPEELQSALDTLAASHSSVSNGGQIPTDLANVASHLVDTGVITQWQCDKLQSGKYKGFFLGKYKLLGHIGTGGMSSVYLAEHLHMRRRVAIKVLPRSRVDDSSYLDRFYREARAAAALDHPNIVRAYDIDSVDSLHYLVMEFVEGRDLQQIVTQSDKLLDSDLVAHYIAQAAAGLQHAHDAGLIHRDIKPANLLADPSHQLKILDLGLARFSDNEKASITDDHDEGVFGTADYLSPEQALNSHDVDTRADIYALGCTMYFALVGHAPFPKGTLAQRIAQHQSANTTPIRQLRADCPDSLAATCDRMMQKQAQDRIQTAAEIHQQLTRWLADRGSRWSGGPDNSTVTKKTSSPAMTDSSDGYADKPGVDLPFVVTEPTSRVARHRARVRDSKNRNEKPKSSVPAPTQSTQQQGNPPPATPVPAPVPDQIPSAPVGAIPQVQAEQTPLLEARRDRMHRAKKPPVWLWAIMGLLTLFAIVLSVLQLL